MAGHCKHQHGYRITFPRYDGEWSGVNWIMCSDCMASVPLPTPWCLSDASNLAGVI